MSTKTHKSHISHTSHKPYQPHHNRLLLLSALALASLLAGGQPMPAGQARSGAGSAQRSADVQLIPDVGHVNTVRAIAYAPDGRSFASAGADGVIKVWDARAAVLLRTCVGPRSGLLAVAFTSDSRRIAAVDEQGSVFLWDAGSGTEVLATDLGDAAGPPAAGGVIVPAQPSAAAIFPRDPSGQTMLVAAAIDRGIALIEIAASVDAQTHRIAPTKKQVAVLSSHAAEVLAISFSPDGKTLSSGSADGVVKVWDAADGSLQYSFKSHRASIRSLCYTGDGTIIADGSDDGDSHRWDLRTGRQIGDRLQHKAPGDGLVEPGIRAVALSRDGRSAATGGDVSLQDRRGFVALWDTATEKATLAEAAHTEIVEALAFSPDGQNLATGGRDHTVRLWDVRTGHCFSTGGDTQSIPAVAYSPKGDLLATGSADSAVRIWSAQRGELTRLLKGHKGTVRAVAFSPIGQSLASGGQDQEVCIWSSESGARLRSWRADAGEIQCIAFSPDGSIIATGHRQPGGRGAIELRSSEGRLIRTLDAKGPGTILSISFSPDGTRIASGTGGWRSGTVTVWNVNDGTIRQEALIGGATAVRSVAFSPDGSMLVSAADRVEKTDAGMRRFGDIRVWNGRTGVEQRVMERPGVADRVNCLTIAPDNRTVYAGTAGGTIDAVDARAGKRVGMFDAGHRGAIYSVSVAPGDKSLASAGADNTVRIWRPEAGKLLVSLLPVNVEATHAGVAPLPTGDWLAAAPEGYYSGSADAARAVRWRMGPDQYPLDAFEKQFHRPEMLRKALSGEPLPESAPSRAFKVGASAPPEIIFGSPKEGQRVSGATLKVEGFVTDTGQVLQMEVLVNGRPAAAKPIALDTRGKPIALDTRGKPIARDTRGKPIALDTRGKPIALDTRGKPISARHANYQKFNCEVALPPGEQQLTVTALAYNGANLAARQELRLARSEPAVKGTLYVLAVGINRYRNPAYNLRFAKQDADAFAQIWKGRAGGLYTKIIATTLADDQATSSNLRAALFRLQEQAMEKDCVAIFLSGHGVQDGERFFFATHEIVPTSARISDTSLPWTALQTALANIRARRVTLFLDACHSGSALGGRQAESERLAELLVKRSGVVVYTSSRGSETSFELDARMHGAFTAALIEGLQEGKANFVINGRRSASITAEDLLAYLRRRVPELSQNRQNPACPLLRDFGEAFPIAAAQ